MDNNGRFLEDFRAFTDYLLHERGMSPFTFKTYERNVGVLARFVAAGYLADYLRPQASELERIVVAYDKGHKPATIALFRSVVRSFYRWLVYAERTAAEAIAFAEALEDPKTPKQLLPVLSVEQMRSLLQSISLAEQTGPRDRAILEVFYASGCRARELAALLLADLDLDAGTVLCRKGKGDRDRLLHLGEDAAEALRVYLNFERPFLASARASPYLFLSRQRGKLSYCAVREIVRVRAKQAGLPDWVRPHSLRRTCATHLLSGSGNIRMVQELLGHASLNATQKYVNIGDAQLQANHARHHPLVSVAEKAPVAVEPEPTSLPADWAFSD